MLFLKVLIFLIHQMAREIKEFFFSSDHILPNIHGLSKQGWNQFALVHLLGYIARHFFLATAIYGNHSVPIDESFQQNGRRLVFLSFLRESENLKWCFRKSIAIYVSSLYLKIFLLLDVLLFCDLYQPLTCQLGYRLCLLYKLKWSHLLLLFYITLLIGVNESEVILFFFVHLDNVFYVWFI